jgi:RNA polymerase sigma-70 factor (ECF subfamily)
MEKVVNTPGALRSVPAGKGGGHDHDILAGCRVGDRSAWRALFDRYSPIVHRFLATFGVPPEEREDACQEVFVAVYRSLTHFRGDARLSTWIYRIAARYASRAARRRRVRTMLSSLLLREPLPPPAPDASERSERLRMLDELVAKLSPKKKLVLVLFEIEGLPIEEVAQIAECPENTAWSRLHYARAELMAMARKRLKVKTKASAAGRKERS